MSAAASRSSPTARSPTRRADRRLRHPECDRSTRRSRSRQSIRSRVRAWRCGSSTSSSTQSSCQWANSTRPALPVAQIGATPARTRPAGAGPPSLTPQQSRSQPIQAVASRCAAPPPRPRESGCTAARRGAMRCTSLRSNPIAPARSPSSPTMTGRSAPARAATGRGRATRRRRRAGKVRLLVAEEGGEPVGVVRLGAPKRDHPSARTRAHRHAPTSRGSRARRRSS